MWINEVNGRRVIDAEEVRAICDWRSDSATRVLKLCQGPGVRDLRDHKEALTSQKDLCEEEQGLSQLEAGVGGDCKGHENSKT